MFSTAEFWVFVAFVLLLASFGKRAFFYLTKALDEHSQKVAHQLEEAERLHDEALSLLNSYKKKHKEAIEQVEKIMSFAEKEAEELKRSAEQAYERFMNRQEATLLERLEIEKEEVLVSMRHKTVGEALALVEHILSTDKKERKKLTDMSLKEVEDLSLKLKNHQS
ncbi:MAG: hypothetical protein HYX35_00485 [Proteobacteria bacterium]|nr:hypothetical protein [Pseudomonadota bacterium]